MTMNIIKLVNIHDITLIDKFYPYSKNGYKYITSAFKPVDKNIIDAYTANDYQYLNNFIEQYSTWMQLPHLGFNDNDIIFFTNYRFIYDTSNILSDSIYLCFNEFKINSYQFFNKCNSCGPELILFLEYAKLNDIIEWINTTNQHFYSYFIMSLKQYKQLVYPQLKLYCDKLIDFQNTFPYYFNSIKDKDNSRLFPHIFEWLISYAFSKIYKARMFNIVNMPLKLLVKKSQTGRK